MPNNRKFYPKDSCLFITSTTEQGLPFIPNMIINAILKGIIARAQALYPQEICHALFMANHFHMIVKVTCPDTLPDFIGYIKCKSADAINRLLGKKKQTIWCDGFDSPILLTKDSTKDKIVYIYTNPSKARLVDSIDEYPAFSTWKAFRKNVNVTSEEVVWIKPSSITRLPSVEMTHSQQLFYLSKLFNRNKGKHTITITHNSWMSSFYPHSPLAQQQTNNELVENIRELEKKYHTENSAAMGPAKLRKQPLNLEHTRKKHGFRTIFISSDINLRIKALTWFKLTSEVAKDAGQNSLYIDICSVFPPGFFASGKTLYSNFFNFIGWIVSA